MHTLLMRIWLTASLRVLRRSSWLDSVKASARFWGVKECPYTTAFEADLHHRRAKSPMALYSLTCYLAICCAVPAIAQLGALIQRKPPATVEVIAPTGRTTLVSVAGSGNSQMSIEINRFKGRAEIHKDGQRQILVLVPSSDAVPSDIGVLADGNRQTVRVFPVSVSHEESDLEAAATPPDTASRDYTVFTQTTHEGDFTFNGASRKTLRRIQISGYRISIENGGKQGLVERLMPGGAPSGDIESVEIYARQVVIGIPLRLPGADVKIYAQSLEFRDHGADIGSIDTTPLSSSAQIVAGQDGTNGQAAGSISLFLSQLVNLATDPRPRFIMVGAVGQQGGPETPGTRGADRGVMSNEPQIGGIVRSWNDILKVFHGEPLPPNWQVYETPKNVVWFYRFDQPDEWGTRYVWPSDGQPGRPGGRPGIGGQGGSLHTAIPVDDRLLRFDGGASGAPRPAAPGADGGNPQFSVGIWIEGLNIGGLLRNFPRYNFYTHRSARSADVPSPSATSATGPNGSKLLDVKGWLHPLAAQAMLAYAEDLYRIGLMTRAEQELSILDVASTSPDVITATESSYVTVRQRISVLRTRISSNLDYFGNPAGWIPPLDLATTLRLLQADLKASSPVLLATELVRMDAEEAKARGDALRTSRDAATARIAQITASLDALAQAVPQLQSEAATVAESEQNLLNNCKQREEQLRRTAEDLANPKTSFLQQALKTIGAVAKVCPVAQPILGSIGGAFDFVSNIGQQSPWETISQIPSLASQFSKENLNSSLQNYKSTVSQINAMDPSNPKALFASITSTATAIGKTMGDFKRVQDSTRVPASKVDEILQQLEAEDPSLKDLTDQAAALTARKRLLAEKIDGSLHQIGDFTSQITSVTERVDSLNRDIVQARDFVDHPAIVAAKDMGRSLRERLDYYTYQVIKAYEYYAGQPYQGNRRAAGTADDLLELLVKSHKDPELAAKAYEATYTEAIRDVGRQILQLLAEEGQRNQKTIDFVFSPQELNALNTMLTPEGAGSSDLFIALEDRGLLPLTDLEARLVKVDVVECRCSLSRGNAPGSANINIDFITGPSGTLKTRTQKIRFRWSGPSTRWGATIDLTKQPPTVNSVMQAEDVGKVLGVFLDMPAPPSYLTLPPVQPGISVRARLLADAAQPLTANIAALRLRLTYSYLPANDVRAVRVTSTVPQGLRPYFFVTAADLGGYRSGLSPFTRIYGNNTQVEIVAPPAVGGATFDGWYSKGSRVGKTNHLIVPSGADSYLYEARYR